MRQRPRSGRTRAVIAALALATAFGVAAAPASADTGGVYFDNSNNAAAGDPSMLFNLTFTGFNNVGLGRSVMPDVTSGAGNTAVGNLALDDLTSGDLNVGIGQVALPDNTTGEDNIGVGGNSLFSNTTGDNNVATGFAALLANQTGNGNVAVGNQALFNSTSSRNVAIGPSAGINLTTGGRNIDIANPGVAGESGTIRIGTAANQTKTFLAGVWNQAISGPTKAVVVNSSGRLGTAPKPAAPLRSQTRTISRLRDRVGQLATAVQRLRKEVRAGG